MHFRSLHIHKPSNGTYKLLNPSVPPVRNEFWLCSPDTKECIFRCTCWRNLDYLWSMSVLDYDVSSGLAGSDEQTCTMFTGDGWAAIEARISSDRTQEHFYHNGHTRQPLPSITYQFQWPFGGVTIKSAVLSRECK